MSESNCTRTEDIAVLQLNQRRFLKLLDGNGKPPVEVRLSKLENMTNDVENIISSQEILRKTVSSFVQAEKLREERKKTDNQLKKEKIANLIKTVGLALVLIGLVYDIFFKN